MNTDNYNQHAASNVTPKSRVSEVTFASILEGYVDAKQLLAKVDVETTANLIKHAATLSIEAQIALQNIQILEATIHNINIKYQ